MTGILFIPPRAQSIDGTGTPRSGALLYLYETGSSVALTTYSDSGLTAEHTSPIVASSAGVWPPIYVDPTVTSVKAVIQTSAGVQISSDDAVTLPITQLIIPQSDAESAAGVTPSDYTQPVGSVMRYGAVADGATDDYEAFAAAWSVIRETGGELLVPPGDYQIDSQVVFTQSATVRTNYKISGYGANITTGASAASAFKLVGTASNFGTLTLCGFRFDHRDNSDATSAVIVSGYCHAHLIDLMVEADDTDAAYSAIWVGPRTAGDNDTNSFWTVIDRCTFQKRVSGDGTNAPVAIKLSGTANATKVTNCSISSFVVGIKMEQDGTGNSLANSVRILHNDFESLTTAIHIVTVADVYLTEDAYGPAGLQVAFNRAESCTNFFLFAGVATLDHSHPPMLFNNYLTQGSVTNYVVNPNDQYVMSLEPNYFGDAGQTNWFGGPSNFTVVTEGAGKNFQIQNISGTGGSYDGAHLVLGAYHIWVEASNGKLRIKDSAPAADNEGTVVGAQTA